MSAINHDLVVKTQAACVAVIIGNQLLMVKKAGVKFWSLPEDDILNDMSPRAVAAEAFRSRVGLTLPADKLVELSRTEGAHGKEFQLYFVRFRTQDELGEIPSAGPRGHAILLRPLEKLHQFALKAVHEALMNKSSVLRRT